jgi:uncharacterized protein (TIGR04255 family)
MGKRIPSKITPDTIITAFFEIRFKPAIKDDELLGKLYPVLIRYFPKMTHKNRSIPPELRSVEPSFKYLADYSFSNDVFSVSLGTNVLVFEYVAAYTGWRNFSSNILTVLREAQKLQLSNKTERLGLRYINLINGDATLDDTFDFSLKMNLGDIVATNRTFKNEFTKGNVNIKVNISENGSLRRGTEVKRGIVVDIDVSQTLELPPVGVELSPIIDAMHTQEKVVFFNILTQRFIDSRNPVYDS